LGREAIKVGNTSVEKFIGRRIRERRQLLGRSPQQLGATIGVLPQQISRYERGMQSISAGLLFEIADALDTSPGYFFEGLEQEPAPTTKLYELMLHLEELQSREHLAVVSQLVRALAVQ
jgi:transcriptional regulator with XRE-family HTH domain